MRKKSIRDLPSASCRSAFTLIELLVVIAILAALMALTAGAVIKYLGVQQRNNTQSTLDRTQSQLNKAWSRVKDQAYKEPIPPAYLPAIQALAGGDANAAGRARVIYVKLKLRQAFPMNFTEALNPAPLPPLPAYVKYLNSLGIMGTSGANYESSACLLMALQRGVSGAGIDPASLTAGGATGSFPMGGGSLTYLTDAWGSPIYFTRVPAGSFFLNPASVVNVYGGIACYSQPGANDPGDPQGYLQMTAWGMTQGPMFSALTLQVLAKGNTSYKLTPLVASSGQDKIPQFDPTTFSQFVFVPTGGASPPGGMPYGPAPGGSIYLVAGDDMFSTP